ncbi:MAG: hypothetical protein JWL69_2622 [Phycisphaerales bacterium]|jgi:hypothetical protein|nr:hypothetical protein [Phycisphaerales bacterium]MDB5355273.1 hypothetical protein [Phycisphaerales bacterium]
MDTESMAESAAFFSRMWMDFATRMMTAGMSFNPFAPPPQAARQARGAYLGAVSEFAEQMMRSPQVLSMMKQAMDASLGVRKQMDEYMTAARHDTQGTASEDIDSLMIDVRHLGTRMGERMDEIEDLLHDIGRRIERLEGNGRNGGHANGTGARADRDALRAERQALHSQTSQGGKAVKGRRRTRRDSEERD